MNINKFQGFIIGEIDYNEYDKIVTLATNDGYIKVLLKGFYKPKSKLASIFSLYNFLDLVLIKIKDDFYRVKEASIVKSFMSWYSPDKLKIGLEITEIIKFYSQNDLDLFELYYDCISSVDVYCPYLLFCLFISQILQINGLSPYVDGDVLTNSDKVNYFSIQDGGFIHSKYSKHDIVLLKNLRKIFKGSLKYKDFFKNDIIDEKIYEIVFDYFVFHTGIKIYSNDIGL